MTGDRASGTAAPSPSTAPTDAEALDEDAVEDGARGGMPDPDDVARRLREARARTLLLVSSLDEEDLRTQHSSLMSPIVWDLGHLAHFEEVWLLERVLGTAEDGSEAPGVDTGEADGDEATEGLRGIYNPFEHPRSTRDRLELPSRDEVLEYMATVRAAVLSRLGNAGIADTGLEKSGGEEVDRARLLRGGMVYDMVLQHEYQHDETILQTLQLKKGRAYRPPRTVVRRRPTRVRTAMPEGMVRFPGGAASIGTDDWTPAYDNERPRHMRRLEPFWIDRAPVTGARYLEFMEDGGYERKELWSPEGWRWKEETSAEAPAYWYRDSSTWMVRVMDRHRPAADDRPVCHVCFHEAEAFARWDGKRLPSEFEWEAAATWDPEAGDAPIPRRFPWGNDPPSPLLANVDELVFDTAPVGSYGRNVSPLGCYGMVGDVWEWTSSEFRGYPGYRTFPYREYSEVFFGSEHRVLRGGSWATRSGAVRSTFRNWDYPIRRQIFAGIRCARDDVTMGGDGRP